MTFFINGAFAPTPEDAAQLAARGVAMETVTVAEVAGKADVRLADGRTVNLAGLFLAPRTAPASPLAEQLGCALEEGPTGPFVAIDAMKGTSVPGVFACGDVARPAGSVSLAVGDGALAGAAAHQSLIFG